MAFEPRIGADPTLVRASVTDKVSGLAGARSKSAQPGPASGGRSNTEAKAADWSHASTTPRCRPARTNCELARDQAGNETSADRRLDGQPMAYPPAPHRLASMRAGFEQRAGGPADDPPARQASRSFAAGSRFSSRPRGPLRRASSRASAGSSIAMGKASPAPKSTCSRLVVSPEQSDRRSADRDRTADSGTQRSQARAALRFVYAGSPLVLPARAAITMRFRRRIRFASSRKRVLNGDRPSSSAGRLDDTRCHRAASSSSYRSGCRITGRPSAQHGPTQRVAGRSATASSAREACSGSVSAHACRARRATRSPRAAHAR